MADITLPKSVTRGIDAVVAGQVVLYNASEESLDDQVSGHIFRIEPGASLAILPIKEFPMDKMTGRRIVDSPPEIAMNSDKVANHLLVQSGWWQRGVTPVFGNDGDAKAKEEARTRYIKSRLARAVVMQNTWLATVKESTRTPGNLPPVMSDKVRAEFEFLQRYEREIARAERKRFICNIDGYQHDDKKTMEEYIKKNYAEHLREAGHDDPAPFYVDLDADRQGIAGQYEKLRKAALARGEQPKQEPEVDVASYLTDKAEALGVNLTKADLFGLVKKDPEVIAVITERLARKEAAGQTQDKT